MSELNAQAKRAQSQLRKLLKASDAATVDQGCEMIMTFSRDPELRPVVEALGEGTAVGEKYPTVKVDGELKKRVKAAHRDQVGMWTLRALGALDERPSLSLSQLQIRDLDFLAGLSALESLDANMCKSLVHVDGLAGMSSLRIFSARMCPLLANIDGLAGLPVLRTIHLVASAVSTVAPLAGLPALSSLRMSGCKSLGSVAELAGLESLEYLDLARCVGLDPELAITCETREEVAQLQARLG